ncbi:AraC family transcriptional regulator [Bradyrhizobium sp. 83012]|uniref:AraC family transcriptional regulator n=1 Tax=Bradyrhizobium aeschynomenes TaxID=2734909 RepID=A0ABX2CB55_9BRAD|nr:AraC family transcriptional regulator [Bradyrhizobium aeschynomenes]NPU11940.1 AraC family transcriptional regulator [Bradyrhizobium aeschynomenes]NPU65474.1 AraC family transcriptional regulator [Bradyrhizobium aeschynomenes]NPV22148.1 AraC family transcriptional regulator [Bradyrhizobium aeschynomenes]
MSDLNPRIVEFSTDQIPEGERAAFWREHYGQVMLRVDFEPAPDVAFNARNRALTLPGLQLLDAWATPARISRSGRYLADGADNVILAINRQGTAFVEAAGQTRELPEGEAAILSGADACAFHRASNGRSFTLLMPRVMIEAADVSVEDAVMRQMPADRGALRLLDHYASWLMASGGAIDAQLLNMSVRHIMDLLALSIGPAADLAETMRARGLRAARLRLAKSFLVANSRRRDMSVAVVATKLNVTPRYLQRLFEIDGTTFSAFLSGVRLANAHRMLCDPAHGQLAIASIAYDVGFGDLSHFNRSFRRQYGLTPREVRGDCGGNRALPIARMS